MPALSEGSRNSSCENRRSRDRRAFDKLWRDAGGTITPVKGTGEVRYWHPLISRCITTQSCSRRKDVPVKLISALNHIVIMKRDIDSQCHAARAS
jgi:hypothetical protein